MRGMPASQTVTNQTFRYVTTSNDPDSDMGRDKPRFYYWIVRRQRTVSHHRRSRSIVQVLSPRKTLGQLFSYDGSTLLCKTDSAITWDTQKNGIGLR